MPPESEEISLKFKDMQSSNAFICVVSLAFAKIIFNPIYRSIARRIGHPSVANFVGSYEICLFVFLALAIFYSRVRSIKQFNAQFGFGRPGLISFLKSISGGLILAIVGVKLVKMGLSGGHSSMISYIMKYSKHPMAYLILIVMGTPFIEEVIWRGFIYKAFRQNFSINVSLVFILLITGLTHYNSMSSGIVSLVALIGLNIMTTMIREKTNCIWNCIGCHMAYNLVCLIYIHT